MDKRAQVREVEVDEVIPPAGRREPSLAADPVLKLFAHLLDELFRIPGTKVRFGLDPLLGLFPGLGDTLSGLVSTALLSLSVRHGIPKVVVVRMALNVLLNAIIGAIPVLGDAFSFWFKSNVRNYALFEQYARGQQPSARTDWIFVASLVGGVTLAMVCAIATVVYLIAKLSERLP